MSLEGNLSRVLSDHGGIEKDPSRKSLIQQAVDGGEAFVSKNGALATWTPPESTARTPKDTVIVKRKSSQKKIDWSSPNNIPIDEETFDMAFKDGLELLKEKEKVYQTNRVIGADPSFALPTKTVTDKALTALFTYNMFRPMPNSIDESMFSGEEFDLVVLPYDKLEGSRYKGRLRKFPSGKTSNMIVTMDFDRKLGVVVGSAYLGTVKKLMFTVMNYHLPEEGVLPLHCSANEGKDGNSALLLGLSGTGKTTLSADPDRALLGDDEHGWGNEGIANFENGCYAKLIDLEKEEEPEIWNAIMHEDVYEEHGAIVENALMYPNGEFDFHDDRLTPNSRGSYPLDYLSNIKPSSVSDHPDTILFLTADAHGVLPPVSKLNPNQAMLWFLMGYTSKIPGTETGIKEPQAVFSRFFGEPFMPRNPEVYSEMLGDKMEKHGTNVYLINTGWTGGPYGEGKRIDLEYTRSMVDAALTGELKDRVYREVEKLHLNYPVSCANVPDEVLNPKGTWDDPEAYNDRAKELAQQFSDYFDRTYENKDIKEGVIRECPGK